MLLVFFPSRRIEEFSDGTSKITKPLPKSWLVCLTTYFASIAVICADVIFVWFFVGLGAYVGAMQLNSKHEVEADFGVITAVLILMNLLLVTSGYCGILAENFSVMLFLGSMGAKVEFVEDAQIKGQEKMVIKELVVKANACIVHDTILSVMVEDENVV